MSIPINEANEFLDLQIGPFSLDNYVARKSILQAIQATLPDIRGIVLDVGCGQMPYKRMLLSAPSHARKYIGLDLESDHYQNQPDLRWDGVRIPLPEGSVDSAIATEVLEHCPDPLMVLGEVRRVLTEGGLFLLTVPFLWPLHDIPYDEFRYTPFALKRLLAKAGFESIEVHATGGWDASLAQMLGLWVRRRPMNENVRRILQRLVVPLYRFLVHRDQPPDCTQSVMITGLYATARKPTR